MGNVRGTGLADVVLILLVVFVIGIVGFAAVSFVVSSGNPIQAGDPLYPAWQSQLTGFSDAILLGAGGTITVVGYIIWVWTKT